MLIKYFSDIASDILSTCKMM
uniref:Uncharacterized protein n=1 Tax=Arundo donax TaxID=35708 RepID=A0A0A8Y2M5_ARUDO